MHKKLKFCKDQKNLNQNNEKFERKLKIFLSSRLNSDLSSDEDDEMGTLCQCALKVVMEFLPETKLTPILSHLLTQERADTLSK